LKPELLPKNNLLDLFSSHTPHLDNLLPKDGIVNYYGSIFSQQEAETYYSILLNTIAWKADENFIMGKRIITKRKVAWYGDAPFAYTYSRVTKQALSWTKELLVLKEKVEQQCGEAFNSCLLNLYHSGEEGMSWHSDAERELKKDGAIASVSLGATRKFAFKHQTSGERVDVLLEHGSLLVMKGPTQSNWLHRLPPSKKVWKPRINLTFRTFVQD
jgi:alkylated DNA repair dioxygenase AlkB